MVSKQNLWGEFVAVLQPRPTSQYVCDFVFTLLQRSLRKNKKSHFFKANKYSEQRQVCNTILFSQNSFAKRKTFQKECFLLEDAKVTKKLK